MLHFSDCNLNLVIYFLGSRLRPKTLQAVDVPVIDNRLCEHWHKANGINVVIYDEMMCAGYRGGGKDSCQVSYFFGNKVFFCTSDHREDL